LRKPAEIWMPAQSVRYGQADPFEPVVHDLPSVRYAGEDVPVRLVVRRTEDGMWRGRLLFGAGDLSIAPATAEILCGPSETDLWQAVRDLREHHIRDLYRSVVG
jgi:hypothetical protein